MVVACDGRMEEGRGGVRAASGISFRADRGKKDENQSSLRTDTTGSIP